ncbi:hypothetical protein BC831DRAFT_463672 [Entophlyctis helioformis]|nr:hypothetical protein BC831DRAFT_463672 [Entophlyctis helioformis]
MASRWMCRGSLAWLASSPQRPRRSWPRSAAAGMRQTLRPFWLPGPWRRYWAIACRIVAADVVQHKSSLFLSTVTLHPQQTIMSLPIVGSSLLITLAIDAGIQLAAYAVSAIMQTERFYDLSGALTYQTCTLVALLWRQGGESLTQLSFRQVIAAIMVLLWSTRLGFFLFKRVLRVEDKRFDKYKTNPIAFFMPFAIQIVWVFLTAFPVYIILGNPGSTQPALMWSDIVGLIVWAFGFAVEITADEQKNAFKNKHPQDFVSTGIWAYSRYANYFGEMTLWIGAFILCAGGFVDAWQWVSIVSPAFVIFLLLKVSGVPLAEANAEKRYGARADYQAYKARTSMLILWPPRKDVTQVASEGAVQPA